MAVGTLEGLLARRRLTPGECAGVASSVAAALAVLHASGRAHGGVRPAAILIDLDGSVGLDHPPGETQASPADDIADLGGLLEHGLAPGAPPLLRQLLATCRDPDPAARPDAAELARLVVRACTPVALRLVPASPAYGSVRQVVLAVGVGLAVVAAITAGRAWGGRASDDGSRLPALAVPSFSASPTPSAVVPTASVAPSSTRVAKPVASPAKPDWAVVLAGLDRARGRAFAAGVAQDVASADAAGSPAFRRDVALVDVLARRGVSARGLRSSLEAVEVKSQTPRRVVLQVLDRLASYALVSGGGAVRHRVAARGPRWWTVELRAVDGGWRVWDARPLAR